MKLKILGTILMLINFNSTAIAQLTNRPDFFEKGYEQLEREILRFQQQNPEPSLTIEAEPVQQQWQQLVFEEANFSIWMPQGTLTQETKMLETDTGAIAFQVFASQSQSSRFIVAYSDELTVASTENPEAILARLRDAIIDNTEFELTGDRPIALDEYPGKELRMQNGSEAIAFRMYLIGQRLYVLGASQQNEAEISERAIAFFNSFRLI